MNSIQAVCGAFESPPWSRRAARLPDAVAAVARGRSAQEQTSLKTIIGPAPTSASLAQLVEHALRKRMVVGSIPTGGFFVWRPEDVSFMARTHSPGAQLKAAHQW